MSRTHNRGKVVSIADAEQIIDERWIAQAAAVHAKRARADLEDIIAAAGNAPVAEYLTVIKAIAATLELAKAALFAGRENNPKPNNIE